MKNKSGLKRYSLNMLWLNVQLFCLPTVCDEPIFHNLRQVIRFAKEAKVITGLGSVLCEARKRN